MKILKKKKEMQKKKKRERERENLVLGGLGFSDTTLISDSIDSLCLFVYFPVFSHFSMDQNCLESLFKQIAGPHSQSFRFSVCQVGPDNLHF